MQQPEILSDWAVIGLSGPESEQFAQSQLTSDVAQLSNSQEQVRKNPGQPTAYCEPKGRVIANGYLFCPRPEHYLLAVHASLADSLLKRLRMYVLRTKVELALETSSWVVGSRTPSERPAGCPISTQSNELHLDIRSDDEVAGWNTSETLWQEAAVNAGVVLIKDSTTQQFTPQMINLDETGAVSFSKGCYPGQEIVARTHYLGKVKRRLCRVQFEASELPAEGTRIQDPEGAAAGALLNYVRTDGGALLGLAVVYDSARKHDSLRLENIQGALQVTESLRD